MKIVIYEWTKTVDTGKRGKNRFDHKPAWLVIEEDGSEDGRTIADVHSSLAEAVTMGRALGDVSVEARA